MFYRSSWHAQSYCAIWLQTLSKQPSQQMFLWLLDCTAAAWHVSLLHPMFTQSLLSGRKHHQLWAVLCQNWGNRLCEDGKLVCFCIHWWINDSNKIILFKNFKIIVWSNICTRKRILIQILSVVHILTSKCTLKVLDVFHYYNLSVMFVPACELKWTDVTHQLRAQWKKETWKGTNEYEDNSPI